MKKKTALPAEFKFCHDYCFFLHDQLLETLISGEKAKIFQVQFKHKDKSHAQEIAKLTGEELVTWMEANGYKGELRNLYYKQVCAALLSDFLHFIYEALQCSRKGKLTVAYALLRKPLKDDLFYLEWLLARPADFIRRFEAENQHRFSLLPRFKEQEQIAIIREAIKEAKQGVIPAEFLHALRFKKSLPYGFEPLWQKANHLITTQGDLETEPCNFNFVFSNKDNRYAQWAGLYWFLPILLYHAVTVFEALFGKFAKRVCHEFDIMPLRSTAGLLLCMQHPPILGKMDEPQRLLKEQFETHPSSLFFSTGSSTVAPSWRRMSRTTGSSAYSRSYSSLRNDSTIRSHGSSVALSYLLICSHPAGRNENVACMGIFAFRHWTKITVHPIPAVGVVSHIPPAAGKRLR